MNPRNRKQKTSFFCSEFILKEMIKLKEFIFSYRHIVLKYDFLTTAVLLFLHCVAAALIFTMTPNSLYGEVWERLWTKQYFKFLLARFWITIPMVLDLVIDFREPFSSNSKLRVYFPRLLLALTLMAPTLVKLLLPYESDPALSTKVQGALVFTQTSFIIGSLLTSMYREEDEQTNYSTSSFNIKLGNFHSLLLTLIVKIVFLLARVTSNQFLAFLTLVLIIAAGLHLTWIFLQQSFKLYNESENGRFTSHRSLNDFLHVLILFIYFLAIFLFFFINVIVQNSYRYAAALTVVSPFGMMIEILFVVFLTVIPMRVNLFHARLESSRLKVKLEAIRYLSHEMRSPLNTVIMGLKCVEEQLITYNSKGQGDNTFVSYHSKSYRSVKKSFTSHEERSVDSYSTITKEQPLDSEESVESSEDLEIEEGQTTEMGDLLEIIVSIKSNCNVVLTTLDELLCVDKLEENKLELDVKTIDPWKMVQDVAKSFIVVANEKEIKYSIECQNLESKWFERWVLFGDFFKLSQVLRNFISNALKFTPSDGQVKIYLELLQRDDSSAKEQKGSNLLVDTRIQDLDYYLRLSVRDSGPGISFENQTKLFGQYVQFDAANLQEGKGSGLGLWISKKIVELHGGTIGAESEGQGHGALFFFEIQVHPKSSQKIQVPNLQLNFTQPSQRKPSWSWNKRLGYGSNVVSARSISEDGNSACSVDLEKGFLRPHRFKAFNFSRGNHSARSTASFERGSISRYTSKIAPTLIPDCDCESGVARWNAGLKLLVVDDSQLTRKMCIRMLRGEGHEVEEVQDGKDFVELVRERKKQLNAAGFFGDFQLPNFDVILMDDSMPGLCGPDATKEARLIGFNGLILGVTGNVFEEQIKKYIDGGANLVLHKPLDLQKLKDAVTCFLCPDHGLSQNDSRVLSREIVRLIPQSR